MTSCAPGGADLDPQMDTALLRGLSSPSFPLLVSR